MNVSGTTPIESKFSQNRTDHTAKCASLFAFACLKAKLPMIVGLSIVVMAFSGCLLAGEESKPKRESENKTTDKTEVDTEWTTLFNGKSLEGWKASDFGGADETSVKDGAIAINGGGLITGVTIADPKIIPKQNYEVEYQAIRTDGFDFFAALTFPFGDKHCTFVPDGWTGTVTGLSTIDGRDASENDTTTDYDFEDGKWYQFRIRVTEHAIQCWVGDKRVIAQPVDDKVVVDMRPELEASVPFGFATYETSAALKDIRLRSLTKEEVAKTEKLREELEAQKQKEKQPKEEPKKINNRSR